MDCAFRLRQEKRVASEGKAESEGSRTLGRQVSFQLPCTGIQFQPPLLLQGPSPQGEKSILSRISTKEKQPASSPCPPHWPSVQNSEPPGRAGEWETPSPCPEDRKAALQSYGWVKAGLFQSSQCPPRPRYTVWFLTKNSPGLSSLHHAVKATGFSSSPLPASSFPPPPRPAEQ